MWLSHFGPTAEPVVETSRPLPMLGVAQTHAAAEKASLRSELVAWSLQEKAEVRRLLRALSRMLRARVPHLCCRQDSPHALGATGVCL